MRIDLEKEKNKHLKAKKISLIMMITFFVITFISITLFIIFSNYKIQLLMSIIGSITSSIFAILAIAFLAGGYIPHKHLFNFYQQLESKEEQFINSKIELCDKHITLKKGLSFLAIYIDKQEYYLVDELLKQDIQKDEEYLIKLRGNYVVEITNHE